MGHQNEKYYKLLLGIVVPEAKIKLKASQKKWLEYRDSEFVMAHTIYNDMQELCGSLLQ